MSAIEAIRLARENGIRLGVAGADLILDADREPAPRVLAAIRRHKAGIVALLTAAEDEWTAEDWRVFHDERAGIAEHDGGLSRDDAERQAFECCTMEWLWQHPPTASRPERCAHCGKPLGEPGRDDLPYLSSDGGHVWMHSGCHGDWTARRRAQAVAELAGLGLTSPAGREI